MSPTMISGRRARRALCAAVAAGLSWAAASPAAAQGGNFGLEGAIGAIDSKNRPATFANQQGKTDIPVLIGRVISIALSLVGTLFLILMIYAGFLWMLARGDSKTVDKAKDILRSAVIGLIIVAGAYAFTTFVLTAVTKTSS